MIRSGGHRGRKAAGGRGTRPPPPRCCPWADVSRPCACFRRLGTHLPLPFALHERLLQPRAPEGAPALLSQALWQALWLPGLPAGFEGWPWGWSCSQQCLRPDGRKYRLNHGSIGQTAGISSSLGRAARARQAEGRQQEASPPALNQPWAPPPNDHRFVNTYEMVISR